MNSPAAVNSLLARPFGPWPNFRCVATRSDAAASCNAPAKWMARPLRGSKVFWTYCDHCVPAHAERIPDAWPFVVTRLELRVAVAAAPGDLEQAADEAVRRIAFAVEDAGGLVTGLRVSPRRASKAAAGGPPLRLLLAGRPEPLPAGRSLIVEAASVPSWQRWRRRGGER